MFRPPVTQEQTDAWFQPPPAQPSQLPDPPPYEQPQFARNLGRAVSEIGPELQGMVQAPVEFAKKTADPNLSVPQRLAAAAGMVASATQLDPMLPHAGTTKLPAGEGFVWGAKPIDQIQGLPKSGVMPESRFAKAGSEAGQFSNDELALMKQVVPDAFTQGGVDVPKLHEGLAQSGPVVEVKKLGSVESTPEAQRAAEITHQLDTQYPDWRRDHPNRHPTDQEQALMDEHRQLNQILDGAVGDAQYAFVGPKPENQMPGYVEGLVRIPENYKVGGTQRPEGATHASPLYQGPHFGSEDVNVLSSYRGYNETLPNGEKAFHVIEVQSDWGQARREDLKTAGMLSGEVSGAAASHPLLPHYETLGLKAAIQHAKEIGATKVILPDAETAMMTEGHDKPANVRYQPVEGAQPVRVSEPYTYNWHTPVPKGWTPMNQLGGGDFMAANPNGQMFKLHAVDARTPSSDITAENIGHRSPGSGLWQAEVYAVPIEPKIPQEGGMRLHYDQTLPSAMRKLTGDKGTPVDLGTHKGAIKSYGNTVDNLPGETPAQAEARARAALPVEGSPVFKDAAGKPKTNITGKIYDISKTPDQFKLMKAGDKFSAAKYLPA
jgi:hypothetical protein